MQTQVRTSGTSASAAPRKRGRSELIAVAGITLICTVVTLALGQKIWTSPARAATPPAQLLPFFVPLGAAMSVLFGLGVSFLVFGYRLLTRARQPLWLTYAAYLSIAWLMLSWWPHGNLHRVMPPGAWVQLLYVDYGFHISLMVATAIVALFFIRVLRAESRS